MEKTHNTVVKFEVALLSSICVEKFEKNVLTCLVICTKKEQVYTVNYQSLFFCTNVWSRMGMDGRMDGWVDGWMAGWVGGRARLRIASSNQKTNCLGNCCLACVVPKENYF